MGAGLESTERPSHRIDLAYLYYLPFCFMFTSNDKFHQRMAPLFLRPDQEFVSGTDLKADFVKLNDHYLQLPAEERELGVMKFAPYPPTDGDFLTIRLWDRFMRPEWRAWAREPQKEITPERSREIIEMVSRMKTEGRVTTEAVSEERLHQFQLMRKVTVQKGNWRILPPGIEKQAT